MGRHPSTTARRLPTTLCAALLVLAACSSGNASTGTDATGSRNAAETAGAARSAATLPARSAPAAPERPAAVVPGMEYQIGDTGPGGGVVFHVSAEPFACGPDLAATCNYLEAAPGSSEVRRGWADVPRLELAVDGADATGIGTGWANTLDIIAQGNTDPVTSAAAYADAYEHGGKTDWYLPAKDEFGLLYEHRDIIGEFSGADYWSSTEVSAGSAWSHYFFQGHPFLPHPKNHYTHLIRPIRAF